MVPSVIRYIGSYIQTNNKSLIKIKYWIDSGTQNYTAGIAFSEVTPQVTYKIIIHRDRSIASERKKISSIRTLRFVQCILAHEKQQSKMYSNGGVRYEFTPQHQLD